MENDGIITRRVYDIKPAKVRYSLTELGLTLRPLLSEMESWGRFYKATKKSSATGSTEDSFFDG